MKISHYTYRYGEAVAILVDHVIRFGNVEKVITQSGKDGEYTPTGGTKPRKRNHQIKSQLIPPDSDPYNLKNSSLAPDPT